MTPVKDMYFWNTVKQEHRQHVTTVHIITGMIDSSRKWCGLFREKRSQTQGIFIEHDIERYYGIGPGS